jgi:hypothetical protein
MYVTYKVYESTVFERYLIPFGYHYIKYSMYIPFVYTHSQPSILSVKNTKRSVRYVGDVAMEIHIDK